MNQIKRLNVFFRLLIHFMMILVTSYFIFLIAPEEDVYCEIKYLINMDLGLYLAADILNLFLALGSFQTIVLRYYSLKEFILIRRKRNAFYTLLLQQYFLFVGEFLILNVLSDYLIIRQISFNLIFINLILILIVAHLMIFLIKNPEWSYLLSVVLIFIFRYFIMLYL